MKKKSKFSEAIDIVRALEKLAEFSGQTVETVAGNICFLNKDLRDKFNDTFADYSAFADMSFEERAKSFGYEVETTEEGNKTISVEL